MHKPSPLAIDAVLPAIDDALERHGAVVVVAPPGAGKTTRVPPRLLDRVQGKVWVLQPRRLAARATAARMAAERGEALGGVVGYSVRFERRVSPRTRLEVMTEGLLLRRLQRDPLLEGVDAVVLDEVHERSLDVDMALALLAEVRREVRPDLRLCVMSATLDAEPLAAFLGDAPIVRAQERRHPVEIVHDRAPDARPLDERVAEAVVALDARLQAEPPSGAVVPGHILCFLPGMSEIQAAARRLAEVAPGLDVRPLHGALPTATQDQALAPSPRRKVVLSTNIAETSLTIEGVAAVVDSGLQRQPQHDEVLGIDRLVRGRISRASAEQRAGRAGRLGPGLCRRLWSLAEHEAMAPFEAPEIARAELSGVCLQVRAWGADPERFGWFEAPPEATRTAADALLREIGLLDDGGLTGIGRACAALPLAPRLGRVLVEGLRHGQADVAATICALASERDPFGGETGARLGGDDDIEVRLAALEAIGRGGPGAAWRWGVEPAALRRLLDTRDALCRQAEGLAGSAELAALPPPTPGQRAPAAWLLAGFPDRVARRREPGSPRLLLASGRGATLSERSVAKGGDLLVAVVIEPARRGGRNDLEVPVAVPLEPAWLPARETLETRWDPQRLAVIQRRVRRYGAVEVGERPAGDAADPLAAAMLLREQAAREPDRALSLDDDALALLGRIRWLAAVRPELELPRWDPIGAEAVGDRFDLLGALCVGRRSFDELRRAPVASVALSLLEWPQRQALDAQAPERLPLPSGRSGRVRYTPGEPPRLSLRLQDAFGMVETPRVAGGRVPVVVELLAPNNRPAQVTADIGGFWTSSWPEVRRELRGRYPKHAWPERPTAADARPPGRGR